MRETRFLRTDSKFYARQCRFATTMKPLKIVLKGNTKAIKNLRMTPTLIFCPRRPLNSCSIKILANFVASSRLQLFPETYNWQRFVQQIVSHSRLWRTSPFDVEKKLNKLPRSVFQMWRFCKLGRRTFSPALPCRNLRRF